MQEGKSDATGVMKWLSNSALGGSSPSNGRTRPGNIARSFSSCLEHRFGLPLGPPRVEPPGVTSTSLHKNSHDSQRASPHRCPPRPRAWFRIPAMVSNQPRVRMARLRPGRYDALHGPPLLRPSLLARIRAPLLKKGTQITFLLPSQEYTRLDAN